jgi:hypothetical protein
LATVHAQQEEKNVFRTEASRTRYAPFQDAADDTRIRIPSIGITGAFICTNLIAKSAKDLSMQKIFLRNVKKSTIRQERSEMLS